MEIYKLYAGIWQLPTECWGDHRGGVGFYSGVAHINHKKPSFNLLEIFDLLLKISVSY